jgi:hypothetical protein
MPCDVLPCGNCLLCYGAAIFVREPQLKVAVQGGMDTLVVTASAAANILSGARRGKVRFGCSAQLCT